MTDTSVPPTVPPSVPPLYPPKIAKALHVVMEKCGYVQKKKTNKFHGYNYAGEGDLLDVLRPAMVEAGLLLIPSGRHYTTADKDGVVVVEVEYTLVHADGDVWPEKIVAFGCGSDQSRDGKNGDKGIYKALTGANKYLLFKLFQIETGDDPEQDDRKPGADEKKAAPAQNRRPQPQPTGPAPAAAGPTPAPAAPASGPQPAPPAPSEVKHFSIPKGELKGVEPVVRPGKDPFWKLSVGNTAVAGAAPLVLSTWNKNQADAAMALMERGDGPVYVAVTYGEKQDGNITRRNLTAFSPWVADEKAA